MKVFVTLAALLLVAGCGGSVEVSSKPTTLKGATIAQKANAQLEKDNPRIAHGQLTCADVNYRKGATTRCLRTVELSQGRRVLIGATVTITDTAGGGHYSIQVDKQVKEFGQTGSSIAQDLAAQYAKRYRTGTPQVTCPPYLEGQVGATITCRLRSDTGALDIEVKVVRVDPQNYAIAYTFKQR